MKQVANANRVSQSPFKLQTRASRLSPALLGLGTVCHQPLEQFLALVKSYSGKEHITIEADERSMRMFNSTLNVSQFTSDVKPPAQFVVGKVTDTWVSNSNP